MNDLSPRHLEQPLESISLEPQPLNPAENPRLAGDAPPIVEIADGIELHGMPRNHPAPPVIQIPDGAEPPPGYVVPTRRIRRKILADIKRSARKARRK